MCVFRIVNIVFRIKKDITLAQVLVSCSLLHCIVTKTLIFGGNTELLKHISPSYIKQFKINS